MVSKIILGTMLVGTILGNVYGQKEENVTEYKFSNLEKQYISVGKIDAFTKAIALFLNDKNQIPEL